jgi:hypothetical protein
MRNDYRYRKNGLFEDCLSAIYYRTKPVVHKNFIESLVSDVLDVISFYSASNRISYTPHNFKTAMITALLPDRSGLKREAKQGVTMLMRKLWDYIEPKDRKLVMMDLLDVISKYTNSGRTMGGSINYAIVRGINDEIHGKSKINPVRTAAQKFVDAIGKHYKLDDVVMDKMFSEAIKVGWKYAKLGERPSGIRRKNPPPRKARTRVSRKGMG